MNEGELKPALKARAEARAKKPPTSTGKPDKAILLRHPLLVYAPAQWGPGVRTEDLGIPVEELAAEVGGPGATADQNREAIRAVAADRGTTEEHVRQACSYCREIAPRPNE